MNLLAAAVVAALVLAACGDDESSGTQGASASSGAGSGGEGQGGAGSIAIEGICDAYCACVGCSAQVRAGCTGLWESERKDAVLKDCVPAYDALVDCVTTMTTCKDGVPSDPCDGQRTAFQACIH